MFIYAHSTISCGLGSRTPNLLLSHWERRHPCRRFGTHLRHPLRLLWTMSLAFLTWQPLSRQTSDGLAGHSLHGPLAQGNGADGPIKFDGRAVPIQD